MNNWINVENSLPEDWQHVLVCDANKEPDEYGVEPSVYFATFTSSGLWLDANKYTTNETILNGETGKLQGIRIVETSNISSKFSTT